MVRSTSRRSGVRSVCQLAVVGILACLVALGQVSCASAGEAGGVAVAHQDTAEELETVSIGTKAEVTAAGDTMLPEKTPEDLPRGEERAQACSADVVSLLEERSKSLDRELASAKEENAALSEEMGDLKDRVAELKATLDEVGGSEGIKRLVETAAVAAAATKKGQEAVQRALDENNDLQRSLDAAQEELGELRGHLSKAEKRESEAREEASRFASKAAEVVRKLERTQSELLEAKLPRRVSVKAILEDVNHLGNELLDQTAAARDDVIAAVAKEVEKAHALVLPYYEQAVEIASPYVEKAMAVSEPQRLQAAESFRVYKGKFDESVTAPVNEKWLIVKEACAQGLAKAVEQWEALEAAVLKQMVIMGIPDWDAKRIIKYLNIASLSVIAVLFLMYFGGSLLTYIVIPLVRKKLRLAVWLVKIPFSILFLPIRLLFWLLAVFCRLAFGGDKKKNESASGGTKQTSSGGASAGASRKAKKKN